MLYFSIDQAAFDALPDPVKAEYKKGDDGKYRLDVSGAVPSEKLKEFRDNNLKLQKDLEVFEGVDVAKYNELSKMEKDIRAGKIKDGKTVEELVQERVAEMVKAHDLEKTKLTKSLETTNGELSRLKISDAAVAAGTELGLRGSAREDLVGRVSSLFKLKDGKPVAFNADGQEIYGSGGEPMTVGEYVKGLVEKAPHLFDESKGTGAKGGGGTGSQNGRPATNPWAKASWNMSEQARVYQANPALAKTMAAEHGHQIAVP